MTDRSCAHAALTIVVITYNSAQEIDALLNSLPAAACDLDTQIIVVDNASTDDTLDRVQRHTSVTLISAGGNTGYSAAINIARSHARPSTPFAVLNPDMVVAPGALTRLVDELRQHPTVGVAIPRLLHSDESLVRHLRREPTTLAAFGDAIFGSRWPSRPRALSEQLLKDSDYDADHDVDWAGAALWVISPECAAAVGEWDTSYFLFSEETDYAFRARQEGFRIRFVASATATHDGSGSGLPPELLALQSVNRVRYVNKVRHHSASAYRAAVTLRHLLRSARHAHRLAVRFLLHPQTWSQLPQGDPPAAQLICSPHPQGLLP